VAEGRLDSAATRFGK